MDDVAKYIHIVEKVTTGEGEKTTYCKDGSSTEFLLTGISQTIATVTLSGDGVTGSAGDQTIEVAGGTAASKTVTATAKSTSDNTISGATWSVQYCTTKDGTYGAVTTGTGKEVTISDGTITIPNKAPAGFYKFTASAGSVATLAGEASEILQVTHAASTAASVTLAVDESSLTIPTTNPEGSDVTATFTVTAIDQYDEKITSPSVTWAATPIGKTGITYPTGNDATATLVVSKGAKADITDTQDFSVTAEVNDVTSNAVTVTVARAASAIQSITLSPTEKTMGIPTSETAIASLFDSIVVTDQYDTVASPTIAWSCTNAPSGVTISDGKITVGSGTADGTNATLTATCGGKTATATITFKAISFTLNGKGLTAANATYGMAWNSIITAAVTDGITATVGGDYALDGAGAAWRVIATPESGDATTFDVNTGTISGLNASTKPAAGTYTVKLQFKDNTYTSWLDVDSKEVTVAKKAVTIDPASLTSITKEYDGTTAAGTKTGELALGGKEIGDNVSITSTVGAYADKNVGTGKAVTLTITASGNDKDNYNIPATYTYNDAAITAKSLTPSTSNVTVTGVSDKAYDGATTLKTGDEPVITIAGVNSETVTLTGTVAWAAATKDTSTVNLSGLTISTSDPNKDNYSLSADTLNGVTVSAKITAAPATLSPTPAAATLTYTGSAQTLLDPAGATSDGELQYKLGASGTYGITVPTATDAGTYTVYYKVVGDSNHSDLAEKSVEVTIAKKPVTAPTAVSDLKWTGSEQIGVPADTDYTVSGGSAVNVGSYTATATLKDTKNTKWSDSDQPSKTIEWSIAKKDGTTALNAINRNLSASATSISVDVSSAVPADMGAVTYALGTATMTGTVVIADDPAAAVSGAGIVTATISGGAENATVTLPVTITGANYNASINVVVTLTGKDDATYTAPTAATLTYNGEAQALLIAGSVTSDGCTMQYCKTADGTYGDTIPTETNAGTYTVYYKVNGGASYNNVPATPVSVTIARATLTVTANSKSITVDDTVPTAAEVGFTVSGAKGTDDVTTLASAVTMAYSSTPDNTKAGTYTITPSGATTFDPNYSVEYKTGTLTIKAKTTPTPPPAPTPTPTDTDPTIGGGGGGYTPRDRDTDSSTTTNKNTTTNADGSTTTTVKNSDGSVTETTRATDGSTTTTKTEKTGEATTTEKAADGSTGTTKTDAAGNTVAASATVSQQAVRNAARYGSAVKVPVSVKASNSAASAAAVEIALPETSEPVAVEIPVENASAGTVAVIVHPDGTEEIVKTSTVGKDGVVLTLDGSAKVKIVDNSKYFADVPSYEWYSDNVAWASSHEIMNGTGDFAFAPNDPTSRSMVAQLLFNLDGATVPAEITTLFADVNANDWYAASVNWAVNSGVARGMGDDLFGANQVVTREQFAVMMYNYAKLKGYDVSTTGGLVSFPDAGSVSDWAADAMAWAVGAGLINGTTNADGTTVLNAQGTATRAQVAAIMQRFCEKVAK